jgi:hypothetical protein
VAVEQRLVEGYLVPLGGSKVDVDNKIYLQPFTDVFHGDGGCHYDWRGSDLPPRELNRLKRLVREIPFWHCGLTGVGEKRQLEVDEKRMDEIAEAWVPVITPYGRGVLLYKNCD